MVLAAEEGLLSTIPALSKVMRDGGNPHSCKPCHVTALPRSSGPVKAEMHVMSPEYYSGSAFSALTACCAYVVPANSMVTRRKYCLAFL